MDGTYLRITAVAVSFVIGHQAVAQELFTGPMIVSAPTDGIRPTYGDIDGDGDLDILGINARDGRVTWYENMAMRFVPRQEIARKTTSASERVFYLLDIDRDGDLDAIDEFDWFANEDGMGRYSSGSTLFQRQWPHYPSSRVEITDFDGDGINDLIDVSGARLWGLGPADLFQSPSGLPPFDWVERIASGSFEDPAYYWDWDSDGDLDSLTTGITLKLLENTDGIGSWRDFQELPITVIDPEWGLTVADFNIDGKPDFLAIHR